MSGGLAVSLARALPERVAAAASIHGAWLVRDTTDSPHLDLDAGAGRAVLRVGRRRPHRSDGDDDRDVRRARRGRRPHTIDVITDAVHGFAPAGERYDRAASELHWERVHSLLRRNL